MKPRIVLGFGHLRRAAALVLAGAFAFTFGGCSRVESIAPPPESSIPPSVLAERYADAAAAIPADRYDLDARAAELPAGIDAAFAVARDEIGAESYSGALLGSEGAYENRGANSVDRAQLLAHLLAAKNIPIRFASCRLDAAAAETLATQLFVAPRVPTSSSPVANISGDDSVYARIRARGERDLAVVKAALGGTPAFAGTSHADLIAELEDHAWIQARPNGADWVDLDASFADATPGKSYCTATTTTDALPDSAKQTVTIRVGAETLDAGSLSDSVLLEKTIPASRLRDRQIYIGQTPSKMSFDVGFGDASRYAPVLAVDGMMFSGTGVRFADGAIGKGGAGSTLTDTIAGALAVSTPSDASPPPTAGRYLVAEWLEFTVTLPNGKTDTSRRFLFDRGGSAWRASAGHDPAKLAPMRVDAQGPLAAQSVFEVCVTAGRHDIRSYYNGIATFLKTFAPFADATPAPDASASPDDRPDFFTTMWPFSLRNFAVAMISDERVVPALDDRPGVRFYADSPRIVVFEAGIDPASGDAVLSTDLRRDPLRAIAKDANDATATSEGTLDYGIMEGAVETELAEPPLSQRVAGDSFGSTSELLGADGVAVLRPGADLGAVEEPETAARLRTALQRGATLVVPRHVLGGGPSGWWELASDASSVRAVFDDLGGAGYKGPVRVKVGGYSSGPKTYDLSNAGKTKPKFELARSSGRGGTEYSALLIAVLIVTAVIVVLAGVAIYQVITKKAQPQLEN
ncbi:MAG: hypothetical protein IAI48_08330 [Candidatus Eremiobacteraeota bacterium]|nr:hypothetical protein [Candidatus Eremiobacteraeota bacterium]